MRKPVLLGLITLALIFMVNSATSTPVRIYVVDADCGNFNAVLADVYLDGTNWYKKIGETRVHFDSQGMGINYWEGNIKPGQHTLYAKWGKDKLLPRHSGSVSWNIGGNSQQWITIKTYKVRNF